MSQRRSRGNAVNNTEDISELEDGIKECVRYILCREGSKIPIKRADVLKHLSSFQVTPGQINTVISEANKMLKRIYGYKLVQVEAKSGVQFIVTLSEECDSLSSSVTSPEQRGLLIAALTHIYMTGGPVKEEEMWSFLEEAGLLESNDSIGRKILTNTLTRQLYLSYYKSGEGEHAQHLFEWGQRAAEELPKMHLLHKMAEAFDKTPDYWYEQHKEATEDQQRLEE